jgi:hypothetical protein
MDSSDIEVPAQLKDVESFIQEVQAIANKSIMFSIDTSSDEPPTYSICGHILKKDSVKPSSTKLKYNSIEEASLAAVWMNSKVQPEEPPKDS